MSEKCWKCGMPTGTGGCGCNHVVFGPQQWQFGPPIDNEKELMKAEIARLKGEVERLRAVLEGAGYQSIDNLKIESVEKCKSIGLTAKLLTEREITARVDMTTECGRLRTDLAAARKVIERVRSIIDNPACWSTALLSIKQLLPEDK